MHFFLMHLIPPSSGTRTISTFGWVSKPRFSRSRRAVPPCPTLSKMWRVLKKRLLEEGEISGDGQTIISWSLGSS